MQSSGCESPDPDELNGHQNTPNQSLRDAVMKYILVFILE